MSRHDVYIMASGSSNPPEQASRGLKQEISSPGTRSIEEKSQMNASLLLKSAIVHQAISTGINTAKEMVQYQISIYGDETGNYIKQSLMENKYNNAINLISTTVGIGAAFAVNPVVGATALVAKGLEIGIKSYQYYKQEQLQIRRANAIANYNSLRLGSKLINGNR